MDEPGERYIRWGEEDPVRASRPRRAFVDWIRYEAPFASFEEWTAWVDQTAPLLTKWEHAFFGAQDRYYLLTHILGRRDALHPWLYDRCREVEAEPDDHLDLWARYHYKSTIITFAGCIQEIIRNPEITIGIFAGTANIALPFLQQIKRELETNEILHGLYPDVFWSDPAKEAPQWSDDGIIVRRQSNPKECTIEAYGLVKGMPTGRHFQLLVFDDLVTQDLVTNPEMVLKVTTAWELADNLGCGEGTRKWHPGTRYSFNDTYGVLLARGSLKPRIHPATDDGTMDGNPVFLSREKWAQIKRDQPNTAPAQMLQNPLTGKDNVFKGAWLRSIAVRPGTINVYIMVDPSKGRSATSDRTAIAVIAIDTAGNKYLVDGYRHRMTLSERWEKVRDLYKKWSKRPGVMGVKVGWEQYGLAVDVEYVKERQLHEGIVFTVEELNWARDSISQSKRHRVERLQPDVQYGRFWLPRLVMHEGRECTWEVEGNQILYQPAVGEPKIVKEMRRTGQQPRIMAPIVARDENGAVYDVTSALIEEMLLFPFAPHDDMVDACSRLYDLEPMPPAVAEDQRVRELNEELAG